MHTRVVAGLIAVFSVWTSILAAEQQRPDFAAPKKDSADAEELANKLATLSPRVERNEATLLADCAYATVAG